MYKRLQSAQSEEAGTPMFVKGLFTEAMFWSYVNVTDISTDEQMIKYDMYIMQFYWTMRKNEIMPLSGLWIQAPQLIIPGKEKYSGEWLNMI